LSYYEERPSPTGDGRSFLQANAKWTPTGTFSVQAKYAFLRQIGKVLLAEEQVSAIVGMSPQMVRHYAKQVSKFRLARSAIKLMEAGWANPLSFQARMQDRLGFTT
jgi:hypothetical protein